MKPLIIALLILPFVSYSQDWTYFTSSNDGVDFFYKNHSGDAYYKKIWIKSVGKKISRISKSGKKIIFSGYSIALYNIRCQTKNSAIIKVSHYSSNGNFLGTDEGDEYLFDYPNPGTIGESIIEAACEQ